MEREPKPNRLMQPSSKPWPSEGHCCGLCLDASVRCGCGKQLWLWRAFIIAYWLRLWSRDYGGPWLQSLAQSLLPAHAGLQAGAGMPCAVGPRALISWKSEYPPSRAQHWSRGR